MKLIALQSQISWAEHFCKEKCVTAAVVEAKRRKGRFRSGGWGAGTEQSVL